MSIELVIGIFCAWGIISTAIHALAHTEDDQFALMGLVIPVVAVSPLAFFLLLDGEWCQGDCRIMACTLLSVSLLVLGREIGEFLSRREYEHKCRSWEEESSSSPSISASEKGLRMYDPHKPRQLPRCWMEIRPVNWRKSSVFAHMHERARPREMRGIIPFR